MPPEPLPWDRKDFFRERKHERSESFGSLNRWRDSSHLGSREFGRAGSADYRRPPGHGKQGGWHVFPEEFGHGYVARSSEKMIEDGSFRPITRVEGKYVRRSRDNRGSYSQRDWKSHSSENSNRSPTTLERAHDVNNEQRSREDIASHSSHSNSDFGITWDEHQLKEQHDKFGGCSGSGTVQKSERESSLGSNDWKPLKWTRSGSLSSHGSGFSHSNSLKSIGATDSNEDKVESQINKATPIHSPSVDATAFMTCAAPSEDATSRKKPRLGWGEGLAKFEKKKVEGPEVRLSKDGAVLVASNNESFPSLGSNLVDTSSRLVGFPDFVCPATPSSIACSSSPGLEDKLFGKAMERDASNLCGSPGPLSLNHLEGSSFKLEKLDSDLVANIGSSLMELLESDDHSSAEPNYVRSTAMNKLLLWKGEISKTLEVTESEIDHLENELKSLNSDTGSSCPLPATSSSLPAGDNGKLCNDQDFVTNLMSRPAPLRIDASVETISGRITVCSADQGDICSNTEVEDIDSPGTVTSKLVEPPTLMNKGSSETVDHGTGNLDTKQLTNREEKHAVPVSIDKIGTSTYDDGSLQIDSEKCAAVFGGVCKDVEGIMVENILASNKESANEAYEVFNKLLPQPEFKVNLSGVGNASLLQDCSLIKEKFAMSKRFSKFKERVITLKFKAFQHRWKEDLRLLSIKRCRAKSLKKFELSLRTMHNRYQKHRSSICTRFSPHGNLSLIPTAEIINITRKLLLESELKLYRSTLRMPSQILDDNEVSRFISSNGLVEDPFAIEKERALINPWTQEEKGIFMDKLATLGKDFRKIASFLDHKTTADCVEFYYKNHKSDSFKKTKKLNTNKQGRIFYNNTYLMPSGKRWNREMNAASLDILGTASVMVARADSSIRNRHTYSRRLFLGGCSESKRSWDDNRNTDEPCSSDILGNERETVAADVLAGICGSLSSEAMSSCVTSSIDPGESWKCQKVDSVTKRPLTPEVTDNVDDETCSDESSGEMDPIDWTDEEKSVFVQAVSSYGRDFEMISQCVRTKSWDQCKVFFSKARKCLGLDSLQPGTIYGRTPVIDDPNGGGSGSEDGCLLETALGVCGNKSGSKIDEDLPSSVMKMNHAESDSVRPMDLQSSLSRFDEIHGGEQIDNKDVGTLESLPSIACQTENQAKMVSVGDINIVNDLDKQFELLPIQKSEVVFVNADAGSGNAAEQGIFIAESLSVCEGNDIELPNAEAFIGMKPVDGISSDVCGDKLEEGDKKQNAKASGQSCLQLMVHDSKSTGSPSCFAPDINSCSGLSLEADYQHQVSVELNYMRKPCITSLPQDTSLSVTNCMLRGRGVTQYEKAPAEDKLSSTLVQEQRDQLYNSVPRDETPEPHHGPPLLSKSSQFLRGYPLHMPIKKEINGDISCRNLCNVRSLPKLGRNFNVQFVKEDCLLHKCDSFKPQHSIITFPQMSQKMEQAIDPLKSHSQSLSDSEKPSRNGDVKLFGQILSNPSSLPMENSSIHENEEKETPQHKSSNKTSNVNFTINNSEGNSGLLKFDHNNYLGFENIPSRNYTYWDPNRIQNACSSLPDSAILLAKYPAAFSKYSASSAKMEQQPLKAIVNDNNRNANGVSVFPAREISGSSGVIDYQVCRSRDGTKVPPFTVDVKQRQDVLPEMQRQNGYETLSGLQQQGSEVIGMNVVGRGDIIVGGSCTGVSDPVAAIKMHYARRSQFGGQNRSIIREDESWRGKGDVGR